MRILESGVGNMGSKSVTGFYDFVGRIGTMLHDGSVPESDHGMLCWCADTGVGALSIVLDGKDTLMVGFMRMDSNRVGYACIPLDIKDPAFHYVNIPFGEATVSRPSYSTLRISGGGKSIDVPIAV